MPSSIKFSPGHYINLQIKRQHAKGTSAWASLMERQQGQAGLDNSIQPLTY